MKAAICVYSPRVETYVDAMAAMVEEFPDISSFEFVQIINSSASKNEDKETRQKKEREFLSAIDQDLSKDKTEPYTNALRKSRSYISIPLADVKNVSQYDVVDVTGLPKDMAFDVLAISIIYGKIVGTNSFAEQSVGRRALVGQDDHTYYKSMDTPIISEIHKWRTHVRVFLFFFVVLLLSFGLLVCLNHFGVLQIDGSLLNLFGFVLAVGGLVQTISATWRPPETLRPSKAK